MKISNRAMIVAYSVFAILFLLTGVLTSAGWMIGGGIVFVIVSIALVWKVFVKGDAKRS